MNIEELKNYLEYKQNRHIFYKRMLKYYKKEAGYSKNSFIGLCYLIELVLEHEYKISNVLSHTIKELNLLPEFSLLQPTNKKVWWWRTNPHILGKYIRRKKLKYLIKITK